MNFLAALPSDLKTIDSWALLLKFQQSVLASTQSSIALAYHESDPIGSKILRNVREGVRKNDSLRIANHYKKNYVEIKNRKIREHLPEFPLEILERELPRHVSQNSTMPDILDGLACIFRKRRRFLPAVALNDLVRIVRKFYIPENDGEPISHDGSLISEEIETIQRKVHRTLVEKIWVGYVLKEKMSKKEASLVSQALFEIMTSWWSSDGKDGSVAKIAQKHLNVTAEEYTHDWRTYVEYFVKLAKEEFRNYLDDDIL
ncbi:MAG: hypothetical protein KGJ59_13795 [Bacteroidota bacterium]|nr:hypothetical protein [Bacteroidota bacterium]